MANAGHRLSARPERLLRGGGVRPRALAPYPSPGDGRAATRSPGWRSAPGQSHQVLSASQFGVTLSSLGLGWVAEEALGHAFDGWMDACPSALTWPRARRSRRASPSASPHTCTWCSASCARGHRRSTTRSRWPSGSRRRCWRSPGSPGPFSSSSTGAPAVLLRATGSGPSVERGNGALGGRTADARRAERGAGHARAATDADLIGGVFEFSEKNAREVMTPRTRHRRAARGGDARRDAGGGRGDRRSHATRCTRRRSTR